MTLHGFDHISTASPYPLLLTGNAGMGKRSWCMQQAPTAEVFSTFHVADADRLSFLALTHPDVAVIIDLSSASERVQGRLSKVIDTAPEMKFFLHSDSRDHLVSTLTSRCFTYRIAALPTITVYQICRDHGMADDQAALCAKLAQGCPADALRAMSLVRATHRTRQALSVLKDDSVAELDKLCAKASQADLDVLKRTVYEMETGNYTLWVPEQVEPLTHIIPQMKYVLNGSHLAPSIAYSAIMYAARLTVR